MKQHIAPAQAKEITKEQFYKLFLNLVVRDDWASYRYKKITIGKMIEILELSHPTLHIDKHLAVPDSLQIKDYYEVFQQSTGSFYGDTLCDALWKAVKSILK